MTFSIPWLDESGNFQWSEEELLWYSKPCLDFITAILRADPSRRLSAVEALNHPWLLQAHSIERTVPGMEINIAGALARYRERSILQRTAASIAVEHMSGETLHKLTSLFQSLDTNSDGCISSEEMIQGLKDTLLEVRGAKLEGAAAEDREELEDLLDDHNKVTGLLNLMETHHDGRIAYSDFLAAAAGCCFDNCVDLCWEAFRSFDL